MKLSFRARMTLWYVSALTLLLLITAVALLKVVDRNSQNRLDTALRVTAGEEVERVLAGLPIHGEMPGREQEPFVTVFGVDKRVLGRSANLVAPLPLNGNAFEQARSGKPVYESARIPGIGVVRIMYMRADRPVHGASVLLVGLPKAMVEQDIQAFETSMAVAFVSILIVTAATATVLANRALNPIRELIVQAEAIDPGDLSARLRDPGTRDEFSRLTGVFNRLLSRLESVFEAQRRFTSHAAHELRTPLTILKGETQVILRSSRTVQEYEATLRSSLEEIDKLVGMIDDLLLMARYESGEAEIPRDVVALEKITAQVVEELSALAHARGVRVNVDAAQHSFITGDRKALARLVCKLVENALFYTRPGGKVAISLSNEPDQVRLIVEDTGVGIKTEHLPHTFQRFYRSPSARDLRPEGVGIGLATVAIVARLHGADIQVSSEENRGTLVQVTLPAA